MYVKRCCLGRFEGTAEIWTFSTRVFHHCILKRPTITNVIFSLLHHRRGDQYTMGSNQSSLSDQHVFQSGQGQIGFNLMNSLQQSPESDTTRERLASLDVQKRVTDELQRLQNKEDQISKATDEQIAKEYGEDSQIDRSSVARSISTLSQKLRNQSGSVDQSEVVKKAETAVVRCLRLNDRRPLDCWKEVEEFKREVTRLENTFVSKVVGDV